MHSLFFQTRAKEEQDKSEQTISELKSTQENMLQEKEALVAQCQGLTATKAQIEEEGQQKVLNLETKLNELMVQNDETSQELARAKETIVRPNNIPEEMSVLPFFTFFQFQKSEEQSKTQDALVNLQAVLESTNGEKADLEAKLQETLASKDLLVEEGVQQLNKVEKELMEVQKEKENFMAELGNTKTELVRLIHHKSILIVAKIFFLNYYSYTERTPAILSTAIFGTASNSGFVSPPLLKVVAPHVFRH